MRRVKLREQTRQCASTESACSGSCKSYGRRQNDDHGKGNDEIAH
jgi:hypothetical protein